MTDAAQVRTLAELPRAQAAVRPQQAALVGGERSVTFAELDDAASRVANALLADGVRPGTRIAILAKDATAVYETILGAAKAQAVSLGINWRLAGPEIAFILDDAGAEILLLGAEFRDKVEPLLAGRAALRRVVILGEDGGPGQPAYQTWRAAAPAADPRLPVDAEDVAVQMYTSGTTGHPKGVMLPHRSFFAILRSLAAHADPWIGFGPTDVSLLALPAFHIGGLWWAVTGLHAGATNVLMDAFVGWRALELIQRHRVTKTCIVPAMMQMMLDEPDARTADLTSLATVVYGGSPIPETLLRRAADRFGCDLAQIYGLTETGNTAVCLRPDDHRVPPGHERLRAAGRPYPGVQLRIVGPDGADLPPRGVGEIWIRSPANMQGYWKRPDATAATLVDGYVVTGDAGYLDEDGCLTVCDRVKDMIIYAGENVYPAEVEGVLCAHPDVQEAAVIGVPDDRWGEQVKALVVGRPGAEPRTADLLAHARRHLADFKVPRSVEFVPSLPRTPSGKLKKAELRAPYWRGRDRRIH